MSIWGDIKHGISKVGNAAKDGVKKLQSVEKQNEKKLRAAEQQARKVGIKAITHAQHIAVAAIVKAELSAEQRLRNLTSELLGDSVGEILNSLVDLGQKAIPGKHAQIPLIPCTPFTPGIGVDIDLNASIDVIQHWANSPPSGKAQYLAMILDIAGQEDVLILLPAGNGRIPIEGRRIEQWIEHIIP